MPEVVEQRSSIKNFLPIVKKSSSGGGGKSKQPKLRPKGSVNLSEPKVQAVLLLGLLAILALALWFGFTHGCMSRRRRRRRSC